MRVESSLVQQPLIDSTKVAETKEVKTNNTSNPETAEEPSPFSTSPFSFSGTYSPSSLKAAVDYHAKFLTVAGSNLEAANHAARIPREIIELLSGR
jgi:hypothetical protein